jgi:hypothetical protein
VIKLLPGQGQIAYGALRNLTGIAFFEFVVSGHQLAIQSSEIGPCLTQWLVFTHGAGSEILGGNLMRKIMAILVVLLLAALVGCGGGSDSGPVACRATMANPDLCLTGVTPVSAGGIDSTGTTGTAAASAQGLYIGTTNTGRKTTGLVFSDGSYYVLYSALNLPNSIAGVVQGIGTATSGSFSSTNLRDFNLEGLGVLQGTLSASYTAKASVRGTISYATAGTTTFTGTYDASYEITPSLAAIAGTYSGQVALSVGIQSATVTVSSTGALSGNGNGCLISGTVSPRTDGNAYNAVVAFGASPCYFANQTFTGIGYFDAATKTLYAAAPNASRTDGVMFVGNKP